jgi:hypothetical protein
VPYYGGVGFHDVMFPSLTWGIPLQCPTCTIVARLHSGGHVWPATANGLLWQQISVVA